MEYKSEPEGRIVEGLLTPARATLVTLFIVERGESVQLIVMCVNGVEGISKMMTSYLHLLQPRLEMIIGCSTLLPNH